MSAQIRDLIAEGRHLYAAVLDSGERRVVLSSEGDAAPTTDLLVWAGNNFPVLLDALDEAEEARARAAELEAALSEANAARIRHLDVAEQLRARVAELEDEQAKVRAHIEQRPEYIAAIEGGGSEDDVWRWRGGAEARRQLSEALGWTVPYQHGEKAEPKVGDRG
ncbi:hypothetical protein [Nocardia farcinica]|uniref:Uncharacterized protein n=1 Tax=Nocardia farcinica (strain IFM 10152) TaxID=247156 RepID=Q5YSJ8_NOCFA|nr:hypothetical protein [Nocardia farcinica]BAD58843.1 hypothetical protein NFA_39950 [Nocardia farcinica IFM 10152]